MGEGEDFWKKLGDAGLGGLTVPEKYGGAGLKYLDHTLVTEEISCVSAALGLSYTCHSGLCANLIVLNASEAQKAKYLPKVSEQERIGRSPRGSTSVESP